jgi:hypothetical protein
MKKIEIDQMENLHGGGCWEAFMGSCLAFHAFSSDPSPWTWAAFGMSEYAVTTACF